MIENNWITLVKPNKVDYKISDNKKFGTVVIEPLEKGFGTTLGNGCTSGHGVCGLSRFSKRSLFATCTFVFFGGVTVFIIGKII